MRNLKVLGLAFVAALALSALTASAASATTAVVTGSDSAVGEDTPEPAVTSLTGLAGVKCAHSTYDVTVHTPSTLTLTPTFTGCATSGKAPVTVTHNGCNYEVTLGAVNGAPQSVYLRCPTDQQIEVHVYKNLGHTELACTLEIGTQTVNSANVVVTHQIGPPTHIEIHGVATGIANSASGECATALGGATHATRAAPNAALHLGITIPGLGLETQEE